MSGLKALGAALLIIITLAALGESSTRFQSTVIYFLVLISLEVLDIKERLKP